MDIRVRLLGMDRVIASIGRVSRVLSRETMRPQTIVAEEIIRVIRQSFTNQISPEGEAWPQKSGGGAALFPSRFYDSWSAVISTRGVQVSTSMPEQLSHAEGKTIHMHDKFLFIPIGNHKLPVGTSARDAFPGAFVIHSHTNVVGSDRLWLVRNLSSGKRGGEQPVLEFIAQLRPFVKLPRRNMVPSSIPASVIARLRAETNTAWIGS